MQDIPSVNVKAYISDTNEESYAEKTEINKAELKLTKNKLSSVISDTQIEELKNGQINMYDKVSSIEQTAEEISTTIKDTVTQFGNLTFGGENYIKNSKTLVHEDYFFMDKNFVTCDNHTFLTDENGNYFVYPDGEPMTKTVITTESGLVLTDEIGRHLIIYT